MHIHSVCKIVIKMLRKYVACALSWLWTPWLLLHDPKHLYMYVLLWTWSSIRWFSLCWDIDYWRYVFNRLRALNECSLVAFVAGMIRMSFSTVHTWSSKCSLAGEKRLKVIYNCKNWWCTILRVVCCKNIQLNGKLHCLLRIQQHISVHNQKTLLCHSFCN